MRPSRPDIVAEHADEASFLARLRGSAFGSHAQTISSMRVLDERLLAHLDGLVVAEAGGWEQAAPLLESKRSEEGFVAAFVALASSSDEPVAELAAALPTLKTLTGVRHGFRLARGERVLDRLGQLRSAKDPLVRSLAADALAFRGGDIDAAAVKQFLASENDAVVRSGLELASRLPLSSARALAGDVIQQLKAPNRQVASSALRASLRLGLPEARSAAIELAREGDAHGERALSWLALAGDAQTVEPLIAALGDPASARTAALALARHGHPSALPALIEAAQDPKLSRVATYAVAKLTGLDPATVAPESKEEPAREEGIDRSYLDDEFPESDPARLRGWWTRERESFSGTERLRRGSPLSWETLLEEARGAVLPEREAAILELRLRLPDLPSFETRAWMNDQENRVDAYAEAAAQAARGKALHAWPIPRP